MKHRKILAIFIICLLICHPVVRANVKITYSVKNYANPDNLDHRLRKCEAFNFLGDHCDPIFQFTAYTTNALGERVISVKKEAGPFYNKRYIESVLETSQIEEKFLNTIEFELDIHDNDADNDQLIAKFTRKFFILKKDEIKISLGSDVRVVVIIRIQCVENYYGDQCDVYCRPYSGLWTCHEISGARVCAKPCVHGSCVLTSTSATCVCASGWKGEFCKIPAESSLITSVLLPELPESDIPPSSEPEIFSNRYLPATSHLVLTITSSSTPVTSATLTKMDEGRRDDVEGHTTEANIHDSTQLKYGNSLSDVAPNNTPQVVLETGGGNNLDEGHDPVDKEIHNMTNIIVAWKNDTVVVKHAGGYAFNASSVNMIVLTTISVLIIWAIVFLIVALVFYRWRNAKKGSDHSRALWTKVSYDLSPVGNQQSSLAWMPSSKQKYDGAIIQPGSLRILSNRSSNSGEPRVSPMTTHSEQSDGPEMVRYAASPIHTNNLARYAPPKSDPLPPAPADIPCMKVTESYDELTSLGEDYASLEPDTSITKPLTSFQKL